MLRLLGAQTLDHYAERVNQCRKLASRLNRRSKIVVLVRHTPVSMLEKCACQVRHPLSVVRGRDSRTAPEVVRSQANTQCHLGRLCDRQLDRTAGERLAPLTGPQSA